MIQRAYEDLRLSGSLPTPAGVGMRILELTSTEDYSVEDLAQVLRSDPSLTARILKLANSADRTGVEPCTTVQEAIMRLGGRAVRDLSLAFSLVHQRPGAICPGFDYDAYWGRSLARAVAAQALAGPMGYARPQEAYICGLLAEIGTLALASVHPTAYAEVLERANLLERKELRSAEQAEFDIDHAQAAACLFGDWGLPQHFGSAVLDALGDQTANDAAASSLATVVQAADLMALGMTTSPRTAAAAQAQLVERLESLAEALALEGDGLRRMFDEASRAWVAWGRVLDIPTADPRTLAQLENWSRRTSAESPEVNPAPRDPRGGGAPKVEAAERILVVDTDAIARALGAHLLRSEGYEVHEASSAQEGLRMALELNPGIVLSDIDLGSRTGLALTRSLRRTELGKRMFIILVASDDQEDVVIQAFDAEADDFVVKPYLPRILCARIRAGSRSLRLQQKVAEDQQRLEAQKAELGRLNRKLQLASLTDPLTGLPNRRHAMNRLAEAWGAADRSGGPLGLALVDVDHFKRVNDHHGHDVGDLVLIEVGRVLSAFAEEGGEVCRLGGEEFLVILDGHAEDHAHELCDRMRRAIADKVARATGLQSPVTISVGLAMRSLETLEAEALLKAADQAVYRAKDAGRNQVALASRSSMRRTA